MAANDGEKLACLNARRNLRRERLLSDAEVFTNGRLRRPGPEIADRYSMIEMQLAATAVIEQSICNIGMLLDLAQRNSRADRVHRSSRNKECVAGRGIVPLEQVFDLTGFRRRPELFGSDWVAKPGGDLRPGFCREDVPHLGFAAAVVMLARVGVVGMHLNRKILRGEEKFDQQRRKLEPHLADSFFGIPIPGFQPVHAPDTFVKRRREPLGSHLHPGGDELVKAIETALDLGHGSRVRNTDVIRRPECFAGHHRDGCFGQQLFRELQ